jgi:hypothetical protein
VIAELFHADGRTDRLTYMMNLIVAFRNFAKATNNECTLLYSIYNNIIIKATNSFMFQAFLAPSRKYNICIKRLHEVLHFLMMVAFMLLL